MSVCVASLRRDKDLDWVSLCLSAKASRSDSPERALSRLVSLSWPCDDDGNVVVGAKAAVLVVPFRACPSLSLFSPLLLSLRLSGLFHDTTQNAAAAVPDQGRKRETIQTSSTKKERGRDRKWEFWPTNVAAVGFAGRKDGGERTSTRWRLVTTWGLRGQTARVTSAEAVHSCFVFWPLASPPPP